mgnify:CR=1 FL=1
MLSNEEKNILKQQIQEEIVELEADIRRLADAKDSVAPDIAVGRLSRMDALGEKGVREAGLRTFEHKVILLRKTLQDIDSPQFGICARCGQEISNARIMALPQSRFCVNCA